MIQANELRIGNYIYSELTTLNVKVNTRLLRLIESEIKYNGISRYKPIPLTEETLLKCGFNKNKQGDLIYYLNDYTYSKLFFQEKNGLLKLLCSKEFWLNTNDCKYLHQLQNLYFALTGKELEINL